MTTTQRTPAARMPAPLRRAAVTCQLIGYLALPRLRAQPHRAYRRLRTIDPVHHSPLGIWILSRHADVSAALRHPAMSAIEGNADVAAIESRPLTRVLGRVLGPKRDGNAPRPGDNRFGTLLSRSMLFRDPPDHTRLRNLVSKAFTRSTITALEPRITEIVDDLLTPVEGTGTMDLMSQLAYPLPARVICELLGVPAEDHHIIAQHAPALATRLDPDIMRTTEVEAAAELAIEELLGHLDQLIADRRRSPGSDLLSELLAVEEQGDRLTHDELLATLGLLLLAGHETTANLLGTALVALLARPAAMADLKNDQRLDVTAVEELLRYDGPIQMSQRVTLDAVDIGAATIPAGRIVVLLIAAANRDAAVFEHADELLLDRNPNPHLAFGSGPHFCLGAPLARAETRIALRTIIDRLPELRLAAPPRWRPSFTIRGLTELQLAWHTS